MDLTPPDPERAKRVEGSNAPGPELADQRKLRKKHRKVRSAWIAFVGRIIAQFVGSAATIVLGLVLLHKYQPAATGTATASAAERHAEKTVAVPTTFQRHDDRHSVAVVPLRSFSSERVDADIADSMTDVVTAALADIPGLHVVPRTASKAAKDSRPTSSVSESPGVRYILEGSVTHADNRFRVIVRVVDTERDEQVWTSRYERPVRNMFKMQDEIAAELVRDMRAAMFDREDGGEPTPWATGTRPLIDTIARSK
jgi:TolB-like protein